MFRYLTAGESHGEKLMGIIEGFPANLQVDLEAINRQLAKRQEGYGRSERMKLERDRIRLVSGLDQGVTTGNPIGFFLDNRGRNIRLDQVTRPRPGHADLVGYLKYNQAGARNILERASARETASRVAIGAFARQFLQVFNIEILSHVTRIGRVKSSQDYYRGMDLGLLDQLGGLRFVDQEDQARAREEIDRASRLGDSLGGEIELIVRGLPVGLGSYSNWDRKLDARLAYGLMSIQAIKSISIGSLDQSPDYLGSSFHDPIDYEDQAYRHRTNNAGGIVGGMSNGEDLVIRLAMKPIPTLKSGLDTVDIKTKLASRTSYERSDVCAVPAGSIVAENVAATILMEEFLKVFPGDFMEEIIRSYESYQDYLKEK